MARHALNVERVVARAVCDAALNAAHATAAAAAAAAYRERTVSLVPKCRADPENQLCAGILRSSKLPKRMTSERIVGS